MLRKKRIARIWQKNGDAGLPVPGLTITQILAFLPVFVQKMGKKNIFEKFHFFT
jgi:hypothetical protein